MRGFASGISATDAEFTPVELCVLGAVGLSNAAVSADGSLLVSDGADNRIRAIAP